MIKAFVIFIAVAVLLYLIVRWIIRSEREDFDAEVWLKEYGSSTLFQEFYERHAYKQLGKVISMFEKKHPEELEKIREEHQQREAKLNRSKATYNHLIAEHEEALKTLIKNGEKWYTKDTLLKHFNKDTLHQLVEAHVIDLYNDKYLIRDTYIAEHPFEVNENGEPIKIKF